MTLSLADPPEHATGLPGTSWQVWRDALPRAAGFAVDHHLVGRGRAARLGPILCILPRSARRAGGDGTATAVSEMPPNQAWLADPDGRRHISEPPRQVEPVEAAR
ncbi:MAG: hypothetical protein GEV28_14925 [Actinophytocola sp.]|uniref:hypothetical protein n=1 Tax=Actinophytocola sp. TaxID=1872138 RepID=UPI00132A91B3|nr:hypothetical protein [Actinophytocola sp.]MPZ81616.1 hypothetical protein [Actinophytocola sp.]